MKKKKAAILGTAVCLFSLALAGCQDSAQTQEEIVTPRQEESQEGQEEEAMPESAGADGTGQADTESSVTGAIAQQVQAPESYSWESSDGPVSVKVDAPIVIPQGEGFKT